MAPLWRSQLQKKLLWDVFSRFLFFSFSKSCILTSWICQCRMSWLWLAGVFFKPIIKKCSVSHYWMMARAWLHLQTCVKNKKLPTVMLCKLAMGTSVRTSTTMTSYLPNRRDWADVSCVRLANTSCQHVPHDDTSVLAADSQQRATPIEGTRLRGRTTVHGAIKILTGDGVFF